MTAVDRTAAPRPARRARSRASASSTRLLQAAGHRRVHRRGRGLRPLRAHGAGRSTGAATSASGASWLNTAAYDGIVAVPVALLMIGGEFDLSAGVMIGSSGLLLGILTTQDALEHLAGDRSSCILFGLDDRLRQRHHRRQDEAPELHRHAGHVLHAARAERRPDDQAHRRRLDQRHRRGARVRLRAHAVRLDRLAGRTGSACAVLWWLGLTVVGGLAAVADALRQLDLRRGRRPGGSAQRRRAGRAHEDPAVHGDLDGRRALGRS